MEAIKCLRQLSSCLGVPAPLTACWNGSSLRLQHHSSGSRALDALTEGGYPGGAIIEVMRLGGS